MHHTSHYKASQHVESKSWLNAVTNKLTLIGSGLQLKYEVEAEFLVETPTCVHK